MRAMVSLPVLGVATVLGLSPSVAQPAGSPAGPDRAAVGTPAASSGAESGHTSRSPGAPLDRGPHTPAANQAHRGGGAVLEGAPGAPAPPPVPTPPGSAGADVTPPPASR
jgi:hypothetical protein